jgi:K(+)-stimulated pyrophosphate-energized sodium pump
METLVIVPPLAGVLGLICAAIVYVLMVKHDAGGEKILKIATAIHEGAMVFLHREYTMLALFAGPLFLIIFFSPLGWKTAVAFCWSNLQCGGRLSRHVCSNKSKR